VTPAETSDLVTVKIFSASDICNRTADNVQSMIHFGTMCAIEGRGGGSPVTAIYYPTTCLTDGGFLTAAEF